ncbi:MAG: radical SAM protein [Polyangiaceae bacterium]
MDTRGSRAFTKQLAEMGVREVTLIGGEAYLHDGWLDVVRAIRAHDIELSIVTGGRGFTKERARLAHEAGVMAVGVSIDALEELHDELRGVKGAFQSAIEALRNLREAGVRITANTQITAPALKQIEALFDRLCDEGITAWQVSLTVPMGRAADNPELLLQPYDVLEVMPMLARIHERATARGVRLAPGNDIGYFGPYERLLRGGMGLPDGHRMACTAGRLTLGIEADGSIKGCPSLPTRDYVGGNIRDERLIDIWERSKPLRFTRDRTVDDLWGYCRDCYYAEPCLAGCSWTAHVFFGRLGNNPFCHHRALDLQSRGQRERVRQIAQPEGKPFDHGLFEIVLEEWPNETQTSE